MRDATKGYEDRQSSMIYCEVDFSDFKAGFDHMLENIPMRQELFKGWKGCSNHGCVVTGPKKGMGTNGMCSCITNASRFELNSLQSRLQTMFSQLEKL